MTSLGRRLALKVLIGTPFAAGTIANAAAKEVLEATKGPEIEPIPPSGDGCYSTSSEASPIERLFWNMRELERDGGWVKREAMQYVPAKISSKRSWSPAFKEHVATRDALALHRAETSERGKLEWLVAKGILPKEVLL